MSLRRVQERRSWYPSPMSEDGASRQVSRILRSGAVDIGELLPLVHDQLRRLASRQLAGERRGHTLQPTALVNEAFLKLVQVDSDDWESKAHFFAAAAEAMRRILIDHARGRGRAKRGPGRRRLPLEVVELATQNLEEILSVDQAVRRLEERDPRLAKVVKLRFYAGLSDEETGRALGTSGRTVRRDWVLARAFLQRELSDDD